MIKRTLFPVSLMLAFLFVSAMTVRVGLIEWQIRSGEAAEGGVRETWPMLWLTALIALVTITLSHHRNRPGRR